MVIQIFRKLRRKLDSFARQFDDCIKTRPSREHMRTYLNGQLGPLEGKSVEPIALDAGIAPRTLQEFLSLHRWDEQAVASRLRQLVARDHADPEFIRIGLIDETSFAKKGVMTAGVQRQYCGSTGKIDNCVVSVHLGYVNGDFHSLIDGDLFLPEESWSQDRDRCRAANIPDDVVYRPKWQIALELLKRSRNDGVELDWITADEFYGRSKEFRNAVSDMGINYVVEIPSNLSGWTRMPRIQAPGAILPSGRRSLKTRLAAGEKPARAVSELWERGGPSWQTYQIKKTQKGPEIWHIRETRFYPNNDGVPGREGRLIIARPALGGDVKYFFSDAGPEVPLKRLLYVAFSRWHIERLFQDAKGQVGFDHFEVRSYVSLIRHLVLTTLSLYFLCEQTARLRGEKSVVDTLSGEDGGRGAARPSGRAEGTQATSREGRRQDRIPATAKREGGVLPRQTEAAPTAQRRNRSTESAAMSIKNLAL